MDRNDEVLKNWQEAAKHWKSSARLYWICMWMYLIASVGNGFGIYLRRSDGDITVFVVWLIFNLLMAALMRYQSEECRLSYLQADIRYRIEKLAQQSVQGAS